MDAATGADLLIMGGSGGDVVSLAWSPDGSKIAVATDGSDNAATPWHGTVLIWDAATEPIIAHRTYRTSR